MLLSSLFCSLFETFLLWVILTDLIAKLHKPAVEHLLFIESDISLRSWKKKQETQLQYE